MEPEEEAASQYTSFDKRKEERSAYKEMIAEEAARFIREGQSVALLIPGPLPLPWQK